MQNLSDGLIIDDDGTKHRKSTKVLSKTTISNNSKMKTHLSLKDHAKDKELINTGLHRLVSSFNTKIASKPSKTVSIKKNDFKVSSAALTTDGDLNSNLGLSKQVSIDKCTMTEFEEKGEQIDLESTCLGEQPYRDLQWTDPRLIKKYSLMKQPCKKSLTIPYVSRSEYGSDIVEKDDSNVIYAEDQTFLFKWLYYFCTASVSFIGSMCGITLITVVLWKMLDENILNFTLQPHRNEIFFRRMIRSGANSVFSLVDYFFGKIFHLLTISTSDVFASDEGHPAQSIWYQGLY